MKHLIFITILFFTVLIVKNLISIQPSAEEDLVFTTSDYEITDTASSFVTSLNDEIIPTLLVSSPPPPQNNPTDIIPEGYKEIFKGVFFQDLGGIVIIRARLNDPDVQFFIGHPSQTTVVCSQLDQFGLQVAVNGSGFYAGSGIVDPFGMVDGNIFSTDKQPGITIAITDDNEIVFAQLDRQIPSNTKYAVSGFNRIVINGEVLDRFYPGDDEYKAGYGTVRPRTTISTDGDFLTIVLFESPRTVTSAGEFILENFPGTTDVFNMDGGSSTNGCIKGIGPIVTETGRPVANVFGVYAQNP